jgi:hypothetical protein
MSLLSHLTEQKLVVKRWVGALIKTYATPIS